MPKVTEKEGLELLLMAWKDYDVAMYHARWYSLLAQIFQAILLVLSVFIIFFTVLYTQRCDNEDDANLKQLENDLKQSGINMSLDLLDGNAFLLDLFANVTKDDDCSPLISMSDDLTLGIIFGLSLAMAFVKSLDAYLIPSSRALHLQSGAAELESIIWLYRVPAGISVPSLFDG